MNEHLYSIGTVSGRWQTLTEGLLFITSMALLLNPELNSPKFLDSGPTSIFKEVHYFCALFERESTVISQDCDSNSVS